MGIEFPWPVSHCAVLYKIAKWGERVRAKWKRRYIHLPCLWLNGSICLWGEVTGRSGVWVKANYPSTLPLCTPPPLLQAHASDQPPLYECCAGPSHWGCSVHLDTLGWMCKSFCTPMDITHTAAVFISPSDKHADGRPTVVNGKMKSTAIWRPILPHLITVICKIRMCVFLTLVIVTAHLF